MARSGSIRPRCNSALRGIVANSHKTTFPHREQNMAKGYWITTYRSISNPDALAAYAKLAAPALTAAGGRFLARGIPVKTMEQGLMERTVLIEFPSVDQAVAAYNSPGYKQALAALGKNAAVRDIRIVEGLE